MGLYKRNGYFAMNLNDNWQNKLGIKYRALGISIAVTN